MTLYAGRSAAVVVATFDPHDGRRLDDTDGVMVTLTIFDTDKATLLVAEEEMTYSATVVAPDEIAGGWFYDWVTPVGAPGAYKARVRVTGAGFSSERFADIRPRKEPVPVDDPDVPAPGSGGGIDGGGP